MSTDGQKPLVAGIVGPTASGKTALSFALSKLFPIEIVCMDSMQIYRGMDIGTAKPTRAERSAIPHHLLDVAEPEEEYSVGRYLKEATAAIDGVLARGHLPVLVGGTGLYLRALSEGLTLGHTPGDEAVRRAWEDFLLKEGKEALHARLAAVDEPSAARLHPNDTRRVIRALEVFELTGRPISAQRPKIEDSPYDLRLYAPDWPREELYGRADRRVEEMLKAGLAQELQGLLAGGVREDAQSMQGIGYKELIPYLKGEAELSSCEALIKRRTRNYAKRQLTWFRPDGRIRWIFRADREEFLKRFREDFDL